jgi:hypothetical protein
MNTGMNSVFAFQDISKEKKKTGRTQLTPLFFTGSAITFYLMIRKSKVLDFFPGGND